MEINEIIQGEVYWQQNWERRIFRINHIVGASLWVDTVITCGINPNKNTFGRRDGKTYVPANNTLRLATPAEKAWLIACENADEFVEPLQVNNIVQPLHNFKVGDKIARRNYDYMHGKREGYIKEALEIVRIEGEVIFFKLDNGHTDEFTRILAKNAKLVVETKSEFINNNQVINREGCVFNIGDKIKTLTNNPTTKGKILTILSFRWNKANTEICAVLNPNFPNGIGIDKLELFIEKEKEFILPEYWKIKINAENLKKVGTLFDDATNSVVYSHDTSLGRFLHSHNNLNECVTKPGIHGASFRNTNNRANFTEITFEQFKKYVLKEEIVEEPIEETLLEKAKRLYPINTKFKRFMWQYGDIVESNGDFEETTYLGTPIIYCNNMTIYHNNQWAEIVNN